MTSAFPFPGRGLAPHGRASAEQGQGGRTDAPAPSRDDSRMAFYDIGISAPLSDGRSVYVTAHVEYIPREYSRRWREYSDAELIEVHPHAYAPCPWLEGDEPDIYAGLSPADASAVYRLAEDFALDAIEDEEATDPETDFEDMQADAMRGH